MPRLYPIGGNPPVSRMPAHLEQIPLLQPHVVGDLTTISSWRLSLRRSESTFLVMTVPALYPPAGLARTAPMLSSSSTFTGRPLSVPQSSCVMTCAIADALRSLPNAPPFAVAVLVDTTPLRAPKLPAQYSAGVSPSANEWRMNIGTILPDGSEYVPGVEMNAASWTLLPRALEAT